MIGTATREERDAQERMQEGATSIEAPAGGLGRYAWWQLRDFLTQKAPILGVLAILLMYPLVAGFFNVSPQFENFAREMKDKWLYAMFGILSPLGTLIATRGIVAEDRQQGFHRFLFAKPVKLARYYAQQFAVNFAGLMGVLAVIALLYSVVIAPVPLAPAFIPAAVFFVLFGGVTFLFSTLSRLDWVWTVGSVAVTAWTMYLVDQRNWTFLKPLKAVLLPLESFGKMVVEWLKFVDPRLSDVASLGAALSSTVWPLAYGLGAFALGLFVLKKRSVVR
jgi:hypothetical protein